MFVKHVSLNNFRNYSEAKVSLCPGRNILVGQNAQGKTNFLEAIELFSNGYSDRANRDAELILGGADTARLEVTFQARSREESMSLSLRRKTSSKDVDDGGVERLIKVNSASYSMMRKLRGHLNSVSFKSQDLNLLRGGPKFRREWIDRILVCLKPSVEDELSKYQKVISQRNRLLKTIAERGGSVSTTNRAELKVWDEQAAKYGSAITVRRINLLRELMPKAIVYQNQISQDKENLSLVYEIKRAGSSSTDRGADEPGVDLDEGEQNSGSRKLEILAIDANSAPISPSQIENEMLAAFRELRFAEIARKQTLCGPHRDDLIFRLNGREVSVFASQGQQRSLVLCLKLAELQYLTESLSEPPVLILDDVFAELDLERQALLMSLVKQDMQTIISTTHLAGFKSDWLAGALIIEIAQGQVISSEASAETVRQ